ncbi:hypothetical protein SAMN05216249_12528, partial [Acetitomaculum ruminis DSM 5522]
MFNKIKRNSIYLVAVFMAAFICFSGQKVLAEGTFAPDAEGIYHINSLEDWDAFFETLGTGENFKEKTVCLETDLSIKAKTYENNTNLKFKGVFDGKGHKITYSNDNMTRDTALFPISIRSSTIKNLEVFAKDCILDAKEKFRTEGCILNGYGGSSSEQLTFENIKIYGDIKVILDPSNHNNINCGGMVTGKSKVKNCVAKVNYTIDEESLDAFLQNTEQRKASIVLGQFGYQPSASGVQYENCYALGECSESVLTAAKKLSDYYSKLEENSSSNYMLVAAFVGGRSTSTQEDCFYVKDKANVACNEEVAVGLKTFFFADESMEKTIEELKNQDTFISYDLVDTWGMSEYINDGYPYLKALVNEDLVNIVNGIAALPDADKLTLKDKETVTNLKKAFDALSEDDKADISYDLLNEKLTNAKETVDTLEKQEEERKKKEEEEKKKQEEERKKKEEERKRKEATKKGKKFSLKGYKYTITTASQKNPTVTITGYKNKNLKKISVPET